jgi:putative DNA-invertase from lambdoid prophage Rac
MTPRAALYARVSTADQQTLPLQIAAMREYAERRGWLVVASIEDVGSGAKDRPKRAALIKMARQRKVDVILVWRLDRWGRSLPDLIETLRDITAIGVDFASVTEGLDLSTPTGRAMVGMLSVFAQFEREVMVERVRAGLNLARKRGKTLGRPSTARDQADKIRELALEGLNKTQIAKRLNVGRASVFRALAQEPSGA